MGRSNMCNIHTAKKTERTQEEITISGNPAKPQGEDGATMLKRMIESHSPVTCWALAADGQRPFCTTPSCRVHSAASSKRRQRLRWASATAVR